MSRENTQRLIGKHGKRFKTNGKTYTVHGNTATSADGDIIDLLATFLVVDLILDDVGVTEASYDASPEQTFDSCDYSDD